MTHPTRSLHEVIESTVELAAHRVSDNDVSLNCYISPNCRSVFAFDPWCVTQLIMNLLSNALQYTESGAVTVEVACQPRNERAEVTISIIDTGPGIGDAVQRIMFASPDQRELMPNHEEIGYGVVISQQLCESMGAKLSIESAPGSGTRVTVNGSFDCAPGDNSRAGAVADALRDTQALIVDTDLSARRLLEAHLRSWGIAVRSVLDTASAIDRVRELAAHDHAISMVFINQDAPHDEVQALIEQLHHSKVHHDAMLVVTGSDMATGRIHVTSGDRYGIPLGSPVRPSALFDCVAQHPFVQSRVKAAADMPGVLDRDSAERHVLLVEDNIVNQCVASEILKRIGVTVDIANNGVEALQMLIDTHYDFVFMDCQMPEMDGFEATRHIRKRGDLDELPVVALTANAMSDDRQSCLDAGMSDYLTKPFTRDQLETMLDKWTTGRAGVAATVIDGTSEFASIDLVDQAALTEIRMLDNDGESSIFDEIISEYLASSSALVRDIETALAARQADAVARCSHALKSSSAAVGLCYFAQQCARLEALGVIGDIEQIAALWMQAVTCYRRSVDQLTSDSNRQVA